ncbi:hypothetical protein [Aquimixticola soesokkakensis]|uniref:hypothetical protein n=1 Tax=Aquimixticola soesokkakensis TaxID=1519096 RepID=UPI00190EFCE5|nr:hypothetical protein [Aquimixticola soesokkakensis]
MTNKTIHDLQPASPEPRARRDAAQTEATFRHRLRRETAVQHAQTEDAFAPFMADPQPHLAWFLAAQRAGLVAVFDSREVASTPGCTALMAQLTDRLDADLAQLGARCVATPPDSGLDPLAVDYLVLGSRLGTEVMRRQLWPQDTGALPPSYFLGGDARDLWRAHCSALDAIAPQSPRAERVIFDSRRGFALFHRAALAQRTPSPRPAPSGAHPIELQGPRGAAAHLRDAS